MNWDVRKGVLVVLLGATAIPIYSPSAEAQSAMINGPMPGARVSPVASARISFWELASETSLSPQADESNHRLVLPPRMPLPTFEPDLVQGPISGGNAGTLPHSQIPIITPRLMAPPLTDNFPALEDNGMAIPPDTHGAVGPDHLMITLNSEVRVQTKDGANLSTVSLNEFWSALPVSDVFDPKVIFDPLSGRFVFVTVAERQSAESSMLLAVSATSDPTQEWFLWQLDGDPNDQIWVDFPSIGANRNWITFTANMYDNASDSFEGVNIWAVEKSSALAGMGELDTTLFFVPADQSGGTVVPCLTFSSEEETQYLVNTLIGNFLGQAFLGLGTITGTPASPILTFDINDPRNLVVSTDTWEDLNFPGAPQLGIPELVDAGDTRMRNAVLRNGSLWCSHSVALLDVDLVRTAVRWWEIEPLSKTVIQNGTIEDAVSDMHYYYPSIAVNVNDDVLIGFSGSSPTTYVGAYYTFRRSGDPEGTVDSVSLMKEGENPYFKNFGGVRNRWGDYSATVVDPVDDTSMWRISWVIRQGGRGEALCGSIAGPGCGFGITSPRQDDANAPA